MHKHFVSVIIAAAGNSSRMGGDVSKQLMTLSGKSVIEYSIEAFSNSELINEIVISAKENEIDTIKEYMLRYPKITKVVTGGATRQESVANALNSLSEDSEYVAIHDAARPLITTEDIDSIIKETFKYDAVCPVSPVVDTVKRATNGIIEQTDDRSKLFLASTPQTFKTSLYKEAFFNTDNLQNYTDDSSIVEAFGKEVHIFVMDKNNIKITTQKDINTVKNSLSLPQIKVGHGYDVHRLVENRKLIIGGVDIPHEVGLLGHSDADVLLHAIMDALLGAAGLGDIGRHFPDTSNEYKGISSLVLLDRVAALLKEKGYAVSNIDATVIAQAPKLAPYIPNMIANIANALNIAESCINVKATTEEKLGFTGEKLGISAHAVCTLIS